jgi:hypothetical protein
MAGIFKPSDDGKQYILSLSYGKDSICIPELCLRYDMPLDRIVHVEIMATDTIPADLPPMMEFKEKADKIILERYGIEVEHIHAPKNYEQHFYQKKVKGKNIGKMYGWPIGKDSTGQKGAWCSADLKLQYLRKLDRKKNCIVYIGIAADEPNRFHNLTDRKQSPLVEHDITEAMARELAESLDLLSPIYTQSARGGCWFCHNQSVQQLRLLRRQYPDYWDLMLKWDADSPVTFKADGHTVHDFDKRFQLEDDGFIIPDEHFKWKMLTQELNYRFC